MNPDISALATYGGTFQKQLIQKFYKELSLGADGIMVMPNIKSKTTLTKLSIGRGLKPYTGTFASEDGQISYTPRTITPELIQRDLSIDPKKYKDTWMAEQLAVSLATNAGKESQIPFAQYVWDSYMKENAEEIAMALYHAKGTAAFSTWLIGTTYAAKDLVKLNGKYYRSLAGSNTGNAVTDATKWERVDYLALFKGFGSKIAYAISDEDFDQISSTGAISSGDSIDQFKSVYRALPEAVRATGTANVYCSLDSFEILLDDIGEKYKNFTTTDGVLYLPETNKKAIVKPVNWLSGSGRVIATPANNMVLGTDQLSDMTKMTFIPQHYSLEASLAFSMDVQFQDLDVLAVNDQS
jgi:hypothetical protein